MKTTIALIALAIVFVSHVAASDTTTRPACAGDERYPDIDYSHKTVRQACESGGSVSGWWAIEYHHDSFDDTTSTTAINFSQIPSTDTTDATQYLAIACHEDNLLVAVIILPEHTGFSPDDFLKVGYRLDGADPQYVKWKNHNVRTVAGVAKKAEAFMLEIYNAKKIQIRVFGATEIDLNSDLSGIQGAVKAIADSCNWEPGQAADPVAAQFAKEQAWETAERNIIDRIPASLAPCWDQTSGTGTIAIQVKGSVEKSGSVDFGDGARYIIDRYDRREHGARFSLLQASLLCKVDIREEHWPFPDNHNVEFTLTMYPNHPLSTKPAKPYSYWR